MGEKGERRYERGETDRWEKKPLHTVDIYLLLQLKIMQNYHTCVHTHKHTRTGGRGQAPQPLHSPTQHSILQKSGFHPFPGAAAAHVSAAHPHNENICIYTTVWSLYSALKHDYDFITPSFNKHCHLQHRPRKCTANNDNVIIQRSDVTCSWLIC